MRKTKPEESLCTLDVAVVVANNHHVVLVPDQQGAVEIKIEICHKDHYDQNMSTLFLDNFTIDKTFNIIYL